MGGDALADWLAQQPPSGPPTQFISPKTGMHYEIVPIQSPGDFVVIETATSKAVGFKTGETITVGDSHRKSGLGVELVLLAYASAPWPLHPTLDVTEAGKRTVERAHSEAVRRAFDTGKANFKAYGLI